MAQGGMHSKWYVVYAGVLNSGHLEYMPRSLKVYSTDGCALDDVTV
jgi:hypothetical protein